MKKKKKIIIGFIVLVIVGILLGISNKKNIEVISESARKEQFQNYIEESVLTDEKNSTRQKIIEESETVQENEEEKVYEEGKVIIVYKSNNLLTKLKVNTASLFDDYKIEKTTKLEKLNISENEMTVATVSSENYTTEELMEKLNEKSWVISAIPNYQFKTLGLTNDEYSDMQWAIQNDGQFAGTVENDIGSITTSSEKEKVIAIIDTGVDYTHEDLVNVMWKNPFDEETLPGIYGYDFVNKDNDPMDDNGHGTHCAGIIAAEANNGIGISGAIVGATNVKIMALKVGNENGFMLLNDIISAYEYISKAQKLGVNIVAINNSWGTTWQLGTDKDKTYEELKDVFGQIVKQSGEKGAISVFSAGNDGLNLDENGIYYGALYNYMAFPVCLENEYEITVAATDSNDKLAYFSNYGDVVDIAAPGVDIYSTYISGDTFNPLSTKKDEYCLYEDFEGEDSYIIDKFVPYIVSEENGEVVHNDATSICSIDIANERFYGASGNALKISIDNSEKNKEINLRLPLSELGIANFSKYAISLDLYVIRNDSVGNLSGVAGTGYLFTGYCKTSLENEEGNKSIDLGKTKICEKIDYWHHWNKVCVQEQASELEYLDFKMYNLTKGQFTIYIDNLVITKDLGNDYLQVLTPYKLLSGTSMSSPHVTASIAVASNKYESYSAKKIKDLILNNSRNKENFSKKVEYGALDMQSLLKDNEIGLVYGDGHYNYDGEEHSINLNVVRPISEFEIYYSHEKELTAENYLSGNREKPAFSNPGEYTVYWYVHSTNKKYLDRYGSCKVVIDNKIVINRYNYSGKYDTEEHSIHLYSEQPTSEIEIYYSTEQELTGENYKIKGSTTNPAFKDVGKYIVYWYAHSINGIYEDISGCNEVYIQIASIVDIENEKVIRNLTGAFQGWFIQEIKLPSTVQKYTGTKVNPIEPLKYCGKELIEGKDYKIKFYISSCDENNVPKYDKEVDPIDSNNIYRARITGIGNFEGSTSTEDFIIEPRNITITAKNQKILEGNQIETDVNQVTIGDDGLADGQVISEITFENLKGEDNQEIIKISNAIIKDSSNNDVTLNYNISYMDGELITYSKDEVIEIQFNDIGLYKSIILNNDLETLYEDEENKKLILAKDTVEQLEALILYDNYGKITDLTGLSSFYNLKSLEIQNGDVHIKDIEEILEMTNIEEVKINSLCNIEELETNDNKMFLPQFLQIIAQKQSDSIITAYIEYGKNSESEILINGDENGNLYVILDYETSGKKLDGDRIIRFKVSGGITDGSNCSVLYNVVAPLTNLETVKIGEKEYIVLSPTDNNTERFLNRDNFPNRNYKINVLDIKGNLVTDNDKLKTGMKIELKFENETKIFTLIVRGDTNGDGNADFKDILQINKHRLNVAKLQDALLMAGDLNNDQNADFKDILQINKFRLGIIDEL